MLFIDTGGDERQRPGVGVEEEMLMTARGGLFFGKEPTKDQLRQDGEHALFLLSQAGYRSASGLVAEVAERAEVLGHHKLASTLRRRYEIRMGGSLS